MAVRGWPARCLPVRRPRVRSTNRSQPVDGARDSTTAAAGHPRGIGKRTMAWLMPQGDEPITFFSLVVSCPKKPLQRTRTARAAGARGSMMATLAITQSQWGPDSARPANCIAPNRSHFLIFLAQGATMVRPIPRGVAHAASELLQPPRGTRELRAIYRPSRMSLRNQIASPVRAHMLDRSH